MNQMRWDDRFNRNNWNGRNALFQRDGDKTKVKRIKVEKDQTIANKINKLTVFT